MKSDDALLSGWEATLARAGDEAAIFNTRGEVWRTFAQIETEAQELRGDLLRDCDAGEVVAIQVGNDASWPALLLACFRSRLVVLPLESAISEQERSAALRVSSATRSIGPKLALENISGAERADWRADAPVLLKMTSGTTATPRAICFTSDQLLADCEQICDTMQIGRRDLNYGVVPISHSYGFSNLLTPLLVRGVPMVLSRDRMPRAILDGLIATAATVFPGMPLFYQALAEIDEPPPLPALRLCISAGAPLPLNVAQNFRAKFQHAIHSFYGSSECGGICYDREALLLEEGFVGRAMERVTVESIAEEEQTPNAECGASRIRVRSAAAATGYFPDAEPEKLAGGIFVPDDLLMKIDSGLRIVGRVSDLINVAGKKVNPAEVEAQLRAFSGVREAVAFGRASVLRNEEIVACVVSESHVSEAELLEHCRRHLSGWQVPKRIFFVEALPVNERGKLSRRALAERFAAAT